MNRILRSRFEHLCANCGKPIPPMTQCYAEPHPYVKETLYIHLACGQKVAELDWDDDDDAEPQMQPAPSEKGKAK